MVCMELEFDICQPISTDKEAFDPARTSATLVGFVEPAPHTAVNKSASRYARLPFSADGCCHSHRLFDTSRKLHT